MKNTNLIHIVLPEHSSLTLQTAGQELRECLQKCGIREDAAAPITVSLGETALLAEQGVSHPQAWRPDSFGSFVRDNTLFIYGETDRAVLYGVYEFLEQVVGVRFYAPDAAHYPDLKDTGLYIPADYRKDETPDFDIRSYWTLDAMVDARYSARMRMMTLWYDEENAPRYGGGMRDLYYNDGHNINRLYTTGYVAIHGQPEDGMVIYSGGRDIKEDKPLTLSYTKNGHPSNMGMLCLSDSQILPYLARGIIERIKEKPHCRHFGLQQEDTAFFCGCEECQRQENKTDLIIKICNAVARQVNAWSGGEGAAITGGENIDIVTLAYGYTESAPTVPVHKNVLVDLALINSMNYGYAYGDEKNQTHSSLSIIKNWEKSIPAENILFYYYATNFNNEHWYCSNLSCLLPSIQFMARYGRFLATLEAGEEFLDSWQALLRMYICKKLLWAPAKYTQADVMAMAKEFCNGYYGVHGQTVFGYIQNMEREFERIRREYHRESQSPYFVQVADHILLANNHQEAITDSTGEKHFLTANDPRYFTPAYLKAQMHPLRQAYESTCGEEKKRLARVLLTADIMYFVHWKYYNGVDDSISYTEITQKPETYPEFAALRREIMDIVKLTDDEQGRVKKSLNLIFGIDEYAGMDGGRHYDFWME